jgi:hypothetical protein
VSDRPAGSKRHGDEGNPSRSRYRPSWRAAAAPDVLREEGTTAHHPMESQSMQAATLTPRLSVRRAMVVVLGVWATVATVLAVAIVVIAR